MKLLERPNALARRAESLRRAGELAGGESPFVLVTVVRTEPATSAGMGDRAMVHPDGTMEGWVGGGCIGPTARREALAALAEGEPRLVRITPDTAATQAGVRISPMTCASEGTADLYVEPFLPRPTLVIAGDSPVTSTLSTIAPPLGFRLVRLEAGSPLGAEEIPFPRDTWMVVASFGEFDEEAVEAGVRLGLPYVGLVASARRAERVLADLRDRGLDDGALSVVRSPAGLPVGVDGQEGISLSVVSEIFRLRAELRPTFFSGSPDPAGETVDPVCGMTVASGRHAATHEGNDYFFCCAGCKRAFEKDPEGYVAQIPAR